ncbi:hypothetical protein KA005_25055 [bacterium]|nr:hypothetical protein [bacterium]
MTREQLYNIWVKKAYDSRGIDRESFFKDIDKWFDDETERVATEFQKSLKDRSIRKEFIKVMWRLIKGESIKSIEKDYGGEND